MPKTQALRSFTSLTLTMRFPVLLKPNAGGFGAGIVKLHDLEEFEEYTSKSGTIDTNDGTVLLQEWEHPLEGAIYRAWFLRDAVQCTVRSTTGMCMGGVCATNSVEACTLSQSLQTCIVALFKACDAQCGSVEFLYVEGDIRPRFFDLNMLSTLPNPSQGKSKG